MTNQLFIQFIRPERIHEKRPLESKQDVRNAKHQTLYWLQGNQRLLLG